MTIEKARKKLQEGIDMRDRSQERREAYWDTDLSKKVGSMMEPKIHNPYCDNWVDLEVHLDCACVKYRGEVGATQIDICNGEVSKTTLSSFENGRSSNMEHIKLYLKHAVRTGNMETFIRVFNDEFLGDN